MLTALQMIAKTRRLVAFPAPPTGGADKLSDVDILGWINDWFKKMSDEIYGIPAYLEITKATSGTLAVVTSAATPAVATADLSVVSEDWKFLTWPNIRSIGNLINRTTGVADTDRAPMLRVSRDMSFAQNIHRGSADYLSYFDYEPGKGLVLIPDTITIANTIRINYKQKFIRIHDGTPDGTTTFTGSGVDDAIPSGSYTGTSDTVYTVIIDSATTFKWGRNVDPMAPVYQVGTITITGVAQLLERGIYITFGATSGRTIYDKWVFTAPANEAAPSFFSDEDLMAPMAHAAFYCALILGLDDPGQFLSIRNGVTADFINNKKTKDLTQAFSYDR